MVKRTWGEKRVKFADTNIPIVEIEQRKNDIFVYFIICFC